MESRLEMDDVPRQVGRAQTVPCRSGPSRCATYVLAPACRAKAAFEPQHVASGFTKGWFSQYSGANLQILSDKTTPREDKRNDHAPIG